MNSITLVLICDFKLLSEKNTIAGKNEMKTKIREVAKKMKSPVLL